MPDPLESHMTLRDAIVSGRRLIGDGAMGTELQRAGLEPGGCGDEWNLTRPDDVVAIHRRYVEAGSEVILTNTFGANRFVLARYDLDGRQADICRAGAALARRAAGRDTFVLGDVGPCGGFLEPLGDISEADLTASLETSIGALLEGGADGIIVETMTALDELRLAVRTARRLGAPVVIASVAYDRLKGGGHRTMMGLAPAEAARASEEAGADVLGANCGTNLAAADLLAITAEIRGVSALPVMLQPNAGQPRLEGDRIVYDMAPDLMARELLALTAVAQVVGACCGSTPDHIAAFRTAWRA
jgi:5-methyltetrahydrofolate--homocysteine methyltransferase